MPHSKPSATAFELYVQWRSAVDAWRGYLFTHERDRLHLVLPQTPTADDPCTVTDFCVDPPPVSKVLKLIRKHPGLPAFEEAALALASATEAVQPALNRHRIDLQPSEGLIMALRDNSRMPSLADDHASWVVQRQLEDVDNRISNGALTGAEDMRERRAFWDHALLDFKDPARLERMAKTVDAILATPRIPTRELELLNLFQRERQEEDLFALLDPIVQDAGSSAVVVCRRWRNLLAYGVRFFASHGPGGEETIHFEGEGPRSVARHWANHMLATTHELRPLAQSVAFTAGDRLPINRMTLALTRILDGVATDIKTPSEAVQPIVEEIATLATPPMPPTNQELPGAPPVLPTLRTGQMPARVLVTLLATPEGETTKRALQAQHRGPGKTDDPVLGNLLTPKGTLANQGFIESEGAIVRLTPAGRQEATLHRGQTDPLGHNSRR